ncbi:MAG: long-chain acyl-CoA synthetase [Alphaproteobacteria bacterium]|jgi:long-chain acyl-CoA synthetase
MKVVLAPIHSSPKRGTEPSIMIETKNLGVLYDAAFSDEIALVDCRDWEVPREYTHRQIEEAANACARGLLKRGLKPGASVALLSSNRAEFLISYLGILQAGMIAVPFNYQFPAATVDFILEDASVSHVICDGPRFEKLTTNLGVTNFDDDGPDGFQALLDPGPFEAVVPTDDNVAMVLYTSGSTGRPKGVPLTHKGHLWALRRRIAGAPADNHRILIAAPMYHMNALCVSLYALSSPARAILLPEFNAKRYLQAIERFGCTWITSVPTMLAMAFAERDTLNETDVSTVRNVRMGSAPISPKLWQQVTDTFVGASVMNGYGTTEAGPIVFGPKAGAIAPPLSTGFPAVEVDVMLIDEDGNEADQGDLWHRTPATMTGYLNLADKTAEVLTDDGWYISGDVFRRDENGAYFFVGRSDDMFVCGGENIYPGEVEALLVGHPDIEQACVVPVPDEIKGEKPVAFVVADTTAGLTEQDVKTYALANAPAFRHPRMVIFVESLPLAGPGKIDRKSLTLRGVEIWDQLSDGERAADR